MSDPAGERRASLEIRNRLGLHARAAVLLVQTANRFEAEITVAKDGQSVNGRSIMGIMMLAAAKGTTIRLTIEGEDQEEAMSVLGELITNGFGED